MPPQGRTHTRPAFVDPDDGSATVYQGAIRGRLLWGCDERILYVCVGLLLAGAFSGAGLYSALFWVVAPLVFFAGQALGKFSPYALDDISAYLRLRLFCWNARMAHDAAVGVKDATFVRHWTEGTAIKLKRDRKPKAPARNRK